MDAGQYDISIHSSSPCEAASSRGAAVSIAEQVTGLTERYLLHMLVLYCGTAFFAVGLVGVIVREFKRV